MSDEVPRVDYETIDEATGFRAAELEIWNAFNEDVLKKPEDDRPDVDSWIDSWSEEHPGHDRKRVRYVATMGIYTGPRDAFNQRTGVGKAFYPNGDSYEGEFYLGQKHGVGHYVFSKAGPSEVDRVVTKALKKNRADHGDDESFIHFVATTFEFAPAVVAAVLEYGALPCYHGEYDSGARTGQGLMKCADGSVYKGEWLANQRSGQGMVYYVNGDVFSGQWEGDKKHGFGTYRFAKGGEYRGEWVKGVFTEGQWIMPDGNYYEGKFDAKNRPCDDNATIYFTQRHVAATGAFKKGVWAPKNEMTVSDVVPVPPEWVA